MGRGRFSKGAEAGELNITSMMDMFTIILVFLLKSFSADGSILTNAENLVLPNSESKLKPAEVNLQLAVTQDMILVDNQSVAPTDDARNIPQDESDPSIPGLFEELERHMKIEQDLVVSGALNTVQGSIIVQLDKNIEFDVLYKVMVTCGKAGYNNMNFAVFERDG
jgi:biopolymer transport protein ExbD